MSDSGTFGLELLLKTVESSIQGKSDVLIVAIHWFLITNGFRNAGIGDDVVIIVVFKIIRLIIKTFFLFSPENIV